MEIPVDRVQIEAKSECDPLSNVNLYYGKHMQLVKNSCCCVISAC